MWFAVFHGDIIVAILVANGSSNM